MNIRFTALRLAKFTLLLLYLFIRLSVEASPVLQKPVTILSQNPDAAAAQKVISTFLKWYKANIKKANSFPILIKDSSDYFMVNKKAVSDYLNFIKSSHCLSPRYIAYWQTFFNDKATNLQRDKIQSDIPEGFDFDFILITQEPELVLNQLNRTVFKTVSMHSTVALITVKWPAKDSMQYEFEMYKSKNGWQIGYISTPNFD